jgi:hypothetical protein
MKIMAKSTKIVKPQSKQVAMLDEQPNYFTQYARMAGSASSIVGMLLKFSKGDFVVGQDNEPLELGTKLIANMDHLFIGWQRWEDARPAEQVMGPVMDPITKQPFIPPRRSELSFNDPAEWEVDESTGKPRDPWVYTHLLMMKEPGKKGQLLTFTTNSAGGKGAMTKLCGDYGQQMREHEDEYPVVSLGVGSYMHSNPAFGRIKFPIFEIVDWADKEEFVEPAEAPAPSRKKSNR